MRKLILFIISLLGWSFILYLITPLITAIGWVIWSFFVYKKLFIKEEIKGTLWLFLILLLISIIYFIIVKVWSHYNYKKYYLKNRRKVFPISMKYESIDFKKIELSEEEIDEIIKSNC